MWKNLLTVTYCLFQEYCGGDITEAEEDDDFETDDEEEPPTKVQITSSRLPQPARKNSQETDSARTTEPKKTFLIQPPDEAVNKEMCENIPKESVDESSIINQIKQINDSIIQSNKAKTKTGSSISVPPAVSIQSRTVPLQPQLMTSSTVVLPSTVQLTSCSDNTKALPVVVQTANGGMAFASVSVGTILGITPEKKYVNMPLSSVIGSNKTTVILPDKKSR